MCYKIHDCNLTYSLIFLADTFYLYEVVFILKNKIIFFAFMFFLLLNIYCVSAQDLNNTDFDFQNQNNMKSDVLSYAGGNLSSCDNVGQGDFNSYLDDDLLSDNDDLASLNDLKTYLDSCNTTANLSQDYEAKSSEIYFQTYSIKTPYFVLDGQGHTIYASSLSMELFSIDSSYIVIKNLKVVCKKNFCNSKGNHFTIINCSFSSSESTSPYVVHASSTGSVKYDGLSVYNSTFTNMGICSSNLYSSYKSRIENCNITDCKYTFLIYGYSGVVSNVRFTNCKECHCLIGNSGSNSGSLMVYDCYFENCTDSRYLLSFGLYGGEAHNCIFKNNSVLASNDEFSILRNYGSGYIFNCSFIGNFAPNLFARSNVDDSKLVWNLCTFINNTGDSIVAKGNISNSIFIGNKVFGTSSTSSKICYGLNMWNLTFIDNYGYDGIAYPSNIIRNCTFINNSAQRGGSVHVINPSVIRDCLFINSKAISGGAIYASANRGSKLNITRCTFINCSSTEMGGVIYSLVYNNIFLNNNNFYNSSSKLGGIIYIDDYNAASNPSLRITNCNMVNSTAEEGGAVYIREHSHYTSQIYVKHSTFMNNKANASSLSLTAGSTVKARLIGNNNVINAFYCKHSVSYKPSIDFDNVTFWGPNGVENTNQNNFNKFNTSEVGQNITFEIYKDGILVINQTVVSNKDGVAILELPYAGNYSIKAYHLDDSYYTYVEAYATYVSGLPSSIVLSVVTSGLNATITATVISGATGNVSFKVNNKTYIRPILENKAVLKLTYLEVNEYFVNGTYMGDVNYLSSRNSTYFIIYKQRIPSNLTINANNITFGQIERLEFYVNGVRSDVVAFIGSEEYFVNDGSLNLTGLRVGKYTVIAFWSGDDVYAAVSNKTNFFVKMDPNLKPRMDIDYDGELVVVTLPDDATGFITFDLNGTKTYVPVVNGKANLTVPKNLPTGEYDLNATYSGDDSYPSTSNSTKLFIQDKRSSNPINLSVEDNGINVDLPGGASGYVIVDVNGTKYFAPIVDGKVNFTMPDDLKPGVYNVTVTYPGDGVNAPVSNSTLVNVLDKRVASFVNIDVDGDVINVVLPGGASGHVILDINGTEYYAPVVGGKANFTLPSDFLPGVYNVTVSYPGDVNYLPSSNSTLFTLDDYRSKNPINLTVDDDVVKVDLPGGASGYVIVDVNGTKYFAPIVDGKANFTMPDDLKPGVYNVTVTYPGDSVNAPVSNSTLYTVKDGRVESFIKLDVDGNVINVEVPIDAKGDVIIDVNGTKYYVPVNNGKSNFTIPSSLLPGVYNITAIYTGDDKYAQNKNTTLFSIPDKDDIGFMKIDKINNNIVVTLPSNATGYVVIDIDGTKYHVPLNNGVSELNIPHNLPNGNYTVIALYSGDDHYNNATNSTIIEINGTDDKIITIINFERVENNLTVIGTLKDADGNVLGNRNLTYQLNDGDKQIIKTDEEGLFKLQAISHSTIKVEFAGTNKFKYANATLSLDKFLDIRNISSIISDIYTTYAIDFDLGERGNYFKFRLVDDKGKALANKPIQIGFCGVVYNRVTDSEGYAQLQINLNTPFIFTFAIAFLGDDDYNASFVVQQINVNKKPTILSANNEVFKASEKTKKFKVTLKSSVGSSIDGNAYIGMGKKVTLNVDGKTYTAKTNAKNQAVFKLSLTKKGTYTATINFEGDIRYDASKTTAKIKIN